MRSATSLAGEHIAPRRTWWLALAAIVIAALLLRLTGYNFSLPYVDHPDEPNFSLAARSILDVGSGRPLSMDAYPPGIITIYFLFHRFLADPTLPPGHIIGWVRLVSIAAGTLTVILAALIARQLHSSAAGLASAVLSGVMPTLVEHSRFGTADTLVGLFVLLALYQVVIGTRFNREGWINASIASYMVAVVFKYQALFMLPLLIGLPLTSMLHCQARRQSAWKHLKQRIIPLVAFFFWLVAISPMLNANEVPYWVAPTESIRLPNLAILGGNAQVSVQNVWLSPLWLIGILGFIGSFKQKTPYTWHLGKLALVLAAMLWLFGISLFGLQELRQFVAFLMICAVMLGIGLATIATSAMDSLRKRQIPRWVFTAGFAVGLSVLAAPYIQTGIVKAHELTLHDRRNDLARWIDHTVSPGGYVAEEPNHKTLNRSWGGYAGTHLYPLIEQGSLFSRPLDEWRAMGAHYAIVSFADYMRLQNDPTLIDLLQQVVPLKHYPPDENTRGPDMVVLRLQGIDTQLDQHLGPIHLIGLDSSSTTVAPGETLQFNYYWRVSQPPTTDYLVFNHLLNDDGRLVAQIDGLPMPDVRRPTTTWDDPNEILVSRVFVLDIPQELPPGNYRLMSGFYDTVSGQRLTDADGSEMIEIAAISVLPS